MKKVYLLLLTAIFFSSCQKDEISAPIIDGTPQEGAVQSIDFKDLPGPILQNFDDNHSIKHKTKRKGLAIGKANTNIPAVKVKNKQGKATYTIAISKSKKTKSSLLYFDNYVVKELQDGSQKKFIIRYLPSQD